MEDDSFIHKEFKENETSVLNSSLIDNTCHPTQLSNTIYCTGYGYCQGILLLPTRVKNYCVPS